MKIINTIFDELRNNLNIELNEQQREAAIHRDGPAIVLAVPGAGKTTTMVVRIHMLIKFYGIRPQNILTMTFSRTSAKDMKERYSKLFGIEEGDKITFSTIHSFALSVIKNYERKSGNRYCIIEGNSNGGVNKTVILKRLFREVNNEYITEDELEELSNDIGLVYNKMIGLKDFHKYNFRVKGFLGIFKEYEAYKRKNNFIDFDDMLTKAFEILQNNTDILSYYNNLYKYVLIDEGQDTSLIQHEIIKLLVRPNNNIFIVADDDQSIYGFRGADPKMLRDFGKTYKGAKKYFIERNYRSSKEIVEVSNEFIKISSSREVKNMITDNPSMKPIRLERLLNDEEQIKYILSYIKSNKDNKNIAILYRNNLSSILLIDRLDRDEITFNLKDAKIYFLRHWIMLDILAFMNFAIDACDIAAFERIYYKMDAYLSKTLLYFLKEEHKDGEAVLDTILRHPELTPVEITKIRELKIKFGDLAELKPIEAIEFILSSFNYSQYIKRYCDESNIPKGNTDEILYIIKQLSKSTPTLIQFICRISQLEETISKSVFNKSRVMLSTIHGVKGLEFDRVILVDLLEGKIPSGDSIKKQEEEHDDALLCEEARIFYVGITRAKEELALITLDYKSGRKASASRFFDRVDEIINPEEYKNIVEKKAYEKIIEDEIISFPVGADVRHGFYGKGTVIESNKLEISIKFKKNDVKTFPSSASNKYIFLD